MRNLSPHRQNRIAVSAFFFLAGLCFSSWASRIPIFNNIYISTTLLYSAAGRSKVLSPGVDLAAVSTIGYLGFLFGPPFIGFIAQAFSLRVSLGLIAILGSVIALFASKIK